MNIKRTVAPAAALLATIVFAQVAAAQSSTTQDIYVSAPQFLNGAEMPVKQNKKIAKTVQARPRFCDNKVFAYLYIAGFRGQSLRIGWAIVMRESMGFNLVPGSPHFNGEDYGIWQINHPTHKQFSVKKLSDPISNSKIAFKLSKGGKDWSAWGIGVTKSGEIYMDSKQYNGVWSYDTQNKWIMIPFKKWYDAYPTSCDKIV